MTGVQRRHGMGGLRQRRIVGGLAHAALSREDSCHGREKKPPWLSHSMAAITLLGMLIPGIL